MERARVVLLAASSRITSYNVCYTKLLRFLGVGLLGPWLYRAFRNDQIPGEDWIALADYLFERLAQGLLSLNGELPHFYVEDTRNLLVRAAPGSRGERLKIRKFACSRFLKLFKQGKNTILKKLPGWNANHLPRCISLLLVRNNFV